MGLILVVFAFVIFCLAAWLWSPTGWYHPRLLALGLAFYMASIIFGGAQLSHLLGTDEQRVAPLPPYPSGPPDICRGC